MTFSELWRLGQHGWPRSYPIAQFPSPPLLAFLAAAGVAALTDGTVHDVAFVVSRVALAAWGADELLRGVNIVRRAFGLIALLYVAAGVLM